MARIFCSRESATRKGIFQAGHEDAALQIDHRVGLSRGQLSLVKPMSRRSGDVVGRAQHAAGAIVAIRRYGLHILDNLAFVPDMVASGEDMRPLVEELVGNPRSYTKPAGRVLRVDHHQVDAPLLDQGAQVFGYDTSPSLAKYVTDKENTQKPASLWRLSANDPATGTKLAWK